MIQVQQHLIILRLPGDLVADFDSMVQAGVQAIGENQENETLEISPDNETPADSLGSMDRFVVTMKGVRYPALLMNLPTPVEAHKIVEGSNVVKSGDIGQIMQLFHSTNDLEAAEGQLVKSTMKGALDNPRTDLVLNDGLTPATANIVKGRYELTRKYVMPALNAVTGVVTEISRAIKQKAVQVDDNPERLVLTTVEEKIVPFESWMVDDENPGGISVVFDRKVETVDKVNTSPDLLNKLLNLKSEGNEPTTGF